MAEQDVPGRPLATQGEDASQDQHPPAWTYDSWFAGWYRTPPEREQQPAPAMAD